MKLQCVILLLKHITMALAMLIYNKLNTSPQPPVLRSDQDSQSRNRQGFLHHPHHQILPGHYGTKMVDTWG